MYPNSSEEKNNYQIITVSIEKMSNGWQVLVRSNKPLPFAPKDLEQKVSLYFYWNDRLECHTASSTYLSEVKEVFQATTKAIYELREECLPAPREIHW